MVESLDETNKITEQIETNPNDQDNLCNIISTDHLEYDNNNDDELKDLDSLSKQKDNNETVEERESRLQAKKERKLRLKRERWEQKKLIMKAKDKERKKKKSPAAYAHLNRFDQLTKEENGEVRKLNKKEKQALFKEQCLEGPRVIIDCDFEHLMLEKEVKSLNQQLGYCGNANKTLAQPMNLIFTGIDTQLEACLKQNMFENWPIQHFEKVSYLEAHPVKSIYNAQECGKDKEGGLKIDKKRLVYLTADSENTIEELDAQDVYIIGGIVDRNRYLNLTLEKAQKEGIRHGKLPIGKHVQLQSSSVLTVNHVFQIIGVQFNCKNWTETLNQVIPERKQK